MILLLLPPDQSRVLLDDMTDRIRRIRDDVVDNNIDHQEHVPLVQFGGQGFEVVGVPETRVEEGRVLDPVTVVGGPIGSSDIDVLCRKKNVQRQCAVANLAF